MAQPLLELKEEVRITIDGGSWRMICKELNAGLQADRLLKEYVVIDISKALCKLTMLNAHNQIVSFSEDAIAPSCELYDYESHTRVPGVTIADVQSYFRFMMGPRTALSLFMRGDVEESSVPDFQELYDAYSKMLPCITLPYCFMFKESKFYKYYEFDFVGLPEMPDLVELHNHHKKISKSEAKELVESGVLPSGVHTRMKAKGKPSAHAYVIAVNEGIKKGW